mmetsp:Transcript_1094/g.2522  ORF Transcript_1094/g.2522 Transcript_1094/m.2522 type:complete len:237 (+) Transcript_1094:278-988(+)
MHCCWSLLKTCFFMISASRTSSSAKLAAKSVSKCIRLVSSSRFALSRAFLMSSRGLAQSTLTMGLLTSAGMVASANGDVCTLIPVGDTLLAVHDAAVVLVETLIEFPAPPLPAGRCIPTPWPMRLALGIASTAEVGGTAAGDRDPITGSSVGYLNRPTWPFTGEVLPMLGEVLPSHNAFEGSCPANLALRAGAAPPAAAAGCPSPAYLKAGILPGGTRKGDVSAPTVLGTSSDLLP